MENSFKRNNRETRRPDDDATNKEIRPDSDVCSLDDLLRSLAENSEVPLCSPDSERRDDNRFEISVPRVTDGQSDVAEVLDRLDRENDAKLDEDSASLSLLYNALLKQRSDESAAVDSINSPVHFTEAPSPLASMSLDADGLRETLAARRLILPEIHDEIFGFHLLHELGRGAFAKVFLVKQGELANRPAVLKISAIEGTEPQTLAQLQHTNVVPIYSVHEDARRRLRGVCMPYLGGACLADILDKVWEKQIAPESGRKLIEALDCVAGPALGSSTSQTVGANDLQGQGKVDHQSAHTPRTTLASMSYVQATAWIVARLAEGLQHSHERNVIHRDIKPSNILISAEAEPLLLDFNVADTRANLANVTNVAGTVPYMAPEQLQAIIKRDHESLLRLTHQSDIYSLGLVLYEMLTGVGLFVPAATSSLGSRPLEDLLLERECPVPSLKTRCSLPIPWSLESIVQKSLAPEPADRYASAAQMAEDLSRFLDDRPLKFAPELSRVEQIQKWGRRHPRLTTACTALLIAASFIIPVALLLQLTRRDLAEQKSFVTDARALEHSREFQAAALRGLCLVNTVIPNEETLKSGIKACEDALGMYQVIQNSNWQEGEYWRRLDRNKRQELSETIRELLLVTGSGYVRVSPDDPAAVRAALNLVTIAQEILQLPKSKALLMDRARYLSLLKMDAAARDATAQAETAPAVSAHDIYMLATAHARYRTVEGYREAVKLLTKAIELSPRHYWSYFQRALCQQELGETLLAVSDLGTCLGVWPESSWAHFNRGYLFDLQGRKNDAVRDYTDALKHSPNFVSAYHNRGLARLELQQYAGALDDFQKVRALGRKDALVDAGIAMAYEGLGRHADADALFETAMKTAESTANASMRRISWTYAFAVAHRAPEFSQRIFEEILNSDPKHPQALYGKGMLSMQQGRLQDAVHSFDAALAVAPNFIEPLRYRAISLARLGNLQQAALDANACAQREPTNPDSLYVAACVASLSARKLNSRELSDNAIELLERAIACGALRERAVADPDFSALRTDPGFQQLVAPSSKKQSEPRQPTL